MKDKKYRVRIDLQWAQVYEVKAKSSKDAKRKALEKFVKRLPKKDMDISHEIIKP